MAANFGKALVMNTFTSFLVGAGFCYLVPQAAPIVLVYTLGNTFWSHYSGKGVTVESLTFSVISWPPQKSYSWQDCNAQLWVRFL